LFECSTRLSRLSHFFRRLSIGISGLLPSLRIELFQPSQIYWLELISKRLRLHGARHIIKQDAFLALLISDYVILTRYVELYVQVHYMQDQIQLVEVYLVLK
ncbi:MAG: hypothetical protein ACK55Z_06570, partial [bacterium]